MGIAETLQALRVRIPSQSLSVMYTLFRPTGDVAIADTATITSPPLVSCLMVTRGDRFTVKYALECYKNQTYRRRELVVIVDRGNVADLKALLDSMAIDGAGVHAAPAGLTLGALRNLAVEQARGDIVIQWDDDDLYDPLRIKTCVDVLTQMPAAAVLLARLLLWWPARELAAISGERLWEGSIAMWRARAPAYPGLARGEDTPVVEALVETQQIVATDAPLLYVYAKTQANTWHTGHFEKLFAASDYVVRGDEYRELLELLSARVPIEAYAREAREHPEA